MENRQSIFIEIREFQKACWDVDEQSARFKNDITNWESIYISRKISIWISFFLRNTKITPNHVTGLWFFIGVLGAFFFIFQTHWTSVLGVFLIYLSWILDNTDGELARYKKIYSLRGNLLDMVAHGVIFPCIFGALTFSCVLAGESTLFILPGLLATIFVTPVTKMQESVRLLLSLNVLYQRKHAEIFEKRTGPDPAVNERVSIFRKPIAKVIAFIYSQTAILYLLIVAVVFERETIFLSFYGFGLPLVFIPKYMARAKDLERIEKSPDALKKLLRPEWFKF